MRRFNTTESFPTPFNNPADPCGPPIIKWHVRVRDAETGRWWYVKQFRSGTVTWTRDMLYARAYSEKRARFVQSCLPTEF
jgi:hypothetical protein